MAIVTEQKATLGVAPVCQALAVPRATYYRWQQPTEKIPGTARRVPRALSPEERERVLAVLNDDRFADRPPAEVYATRLDEGKYVCSIRTMYRILQEHGEVKERRQQLRHPQYAAPELLATRPNQLWSWDISAPQQAAVGDEGGPLAIGLQEQIANHRKRLGSKAPVVSIAEKVPEGIR
jgi:putative transposase